MAWVCRKEPIEKFPTRILISILRNADPAKRRSKFKNRFVQKIFDWNPLKEKYSIDPILKSFQRGYRYRYYEMLTLLNVDPDLKRFVQKIFDWNPLKEKYTLDPELTETCRTILIKCFHWRYLFNTCSWCLKGNYHAIFWQMLVSLGE